MLHIQIKRDHDSSNLAAVNGNTTLFVFNYRKILNSWLFWIPGRRNNDPIQYEQRAFPWEFFKDLCMAVYFLYFGGRLYNSDFIDIISGKSYVK